MLRILGSSKKMCGGITRRDALQIGGLGALGMSLGDLMRLKSAQASPSTGANSFGRAKSCILLFPYGSPPQHETFDPKPYAPEQIQGELGAISTTLPGVEIGELLPNIARVVDRTTIVRSMTHPFPVHGVAYATTGIDTYDPSLEVNPRDVRHWPYVGSCVDYVFGRRSEGAPPPMPRNMALPWRMNSKNGGIASAGPYAAFLGSGYDPVIAEFEGEATHTVPKNHPVNGPFKDVADPFAGVKPDCCFRIAGAEGAGAAAIEVDRLDRRFSLAEQLEQARRGLDDSSGTLAYDRSRQMALSLTTGSRIREALDVSREPIKLRDQYGMALFGQACLTARRLIERGGKFVTVFWDEVGPINNEWDTHWGHYPRLKGRLLPGFDSAFSALVLDLEQRGLLDETLVVWLSEHGRTPKLNNSPGSGRDHWSRVYSICMAGGGVGRGQVVGASDAIGGDVANTPVSPKDILATIFHLLGIDPHTTVPDRTNRPFPIAGDGRVRFELL